MAFDALIRDVLGTAQGIVGDIQAIVQHEPLLRQDVQGKKVYAAPIARLAVIEQRIRSIRQPGGQEVQSRHRLTFLAPFTIGMHDRLTLPDGTTGPILDIGGQVGSGGPYLVEVWLG